MKLVRERNLYWKKQSLFNVGIVILSLLIFLICLHLYNNDVALAWLITPGVPLILTCMYCLQIDKYFKVLAYLVSLYLFGIGFYIILFINAHSAALMWLFIAPPLAMLSLGTKGGVLFSVLVLILMIVALRYTDHILTSDYGIRAVVAYIFTSLICFFYEKNRENAESDLNRAIARVNTLEGLLPLCAWCSKKVRTNDGDWSPIEEYISDRFSVEVSHSICESCAEDMRRQA